MQDEHTASQTVGFTIPSAKVAKEMKTREIHAREFQREWVPDGEAYAESNVAAIRETP
jgi:hypothetical protein